MPALLPVANVLQLRFGGSYQNQPWLNVLHWEYSGGPPTQANLLELCNDCMTIWDTRFSSAAHPTCILAAVRAIDLSSPDAPQGVSDAVSKAGDSVFGPLPVQIAVVASWVVNYRWRGGHFRTYFPFGHTNAVQNGNSWTDVALNQFRTSISGFMSDMNSMTAGSLSGKLVGVRRWRTEVKGQPPVEIDPPLVLPFTGVVVDSRLDSQRRRLGRDVSA